MAQNTPYDDSEEIIDLIEIIQKGKVPAHKESASIDFDQALSDLHGATDTALPDNPMLDDMLADLDVPASRRSMGTPPADSLDMLGMVDGAATELTDVPDLADLPMFAKSPHGSGGAGGTDGPDAVGDGSAAPEVPSFDSLFAGLGLPGEEAAPAKPAPVSVPVSEGNIPGMDDVDALISKLDVPPSGASHNLPPHADDAAALLEALDGSKTPQAPQAPGDLDSLLDSLLSASAPRAPQGKGAAGQPKNISEADLDDLLSSIEVESGKGGKTEASVPVQKPEQQPGVAPKAAHEATPDLPLADLALGDLSLADLPLADLPFVEVAPGEPVAAEIGTEPVEVETLLAEKTPSEDAPADAALTEAGSDELDELDLLDFTVEAPAPKAAAEVPEPTHEVADAGIEDLFKELDAVVSKAAAAPAGGIDEAELDALLSDVPPLEEPPVVVERTDAADDTAVEPATAPDSTQDVETTVMPTVLSDVTPPASVEAPVESKGAPEAVAQPAPSTAPSAPSLADMLSGRVEFDMPEDSAPMTDGLFDALFAEEPQTSSSVEPEATAEAAAPAQVASTTLASTTLAPAEEQTPAAPKKPSFVSVAKPKLSISPVTFAKPAPAVEMKASPVTLTKVEQASATLASATPIAPAGLTGADVVRVNDMEQRLDMLEAELTLLQGRVDALESSVESETLQDRLLDALSGDTPLRMQVLEIVEKSLADSDRASRGQVALEERVVALEERQGDTDWGREQGLSMLDTRLAEVEQRLGDDARYAALEARLAALESRPCEEVANRLAALESRPDDALEARLAALESRPCEEVANRLAALESRSDDALEARLAALESRPCEEVANRLAALESRPSDALDARLAQMEQALARLAETPVQQPEEQTRALMDAMRADIERAAAESAARILREEIAALLTE